MTTPNPFEAGLHHSSIAAFLGKEEEFRPFVRKRSYGINIFTNYEWRIKNVIERSHLITGMTGSGKSNTVRVYLEELLAAHMPVIICDLEGEYSTLKKVYPEINVMGGIDQDRQPDPELAHEIVRRVLEAGESFVVDLSGEDAMEQFEFLAALLEELFRSLERIKLGTEVKRYLALFIEEAQEFYPEQMKRSDVLSSDARKIVVGINRFAKRGRKRGVSLFLITQRPQDIKKSALSQVSVLVAHRLNDPRDIEAVAKRLHLQSKFATEKFPNLAPGACFLKSVDLHGRSSVVLTKVRPATSQHLARSSTEDDFAAYLKFRGFRDDGG